MDLLYPELSYETMGACFDAFNEVGGDKSERTYQKSVRVCLAIRKIPFREQVHCPIRCQTKKVGDFYIDFLIDDKIVLELKVGERFRKKDYDQVKAYLVETRKPLGLLVRFSSDGVTFCRVLRPNAVKTVS